MNDLLKDLRCQVRLIHPANPLGKIEGERKTFPDKSWLEEFMIIKPNLQRILEEMLHTEEKNKHIKKQHRANNGSVRIG